MPYDAALAERVRGMLARRSGMSEKRMFGGLVFLWHGNMLVAVSKNNLLVRVGKENADEALQQPHVQPFLNGDREMKGWVLVEPDGLANDEMLSHWLAEAAKFVVHFPAK